MFRKTAKRLLAFVAAFVMAFSVALPAFAAGTGSINVNGVAGESYTLYKLFDLDHADGATDTGYAYTTDNETLVNALDEYFDFTEIGDTGVYNVSSLKAGKTAAELAATLKGAVAEGELYGITGTTQVASEDGAVTFSGLDDGYYFVDTTLGSLCVLDSSVDDGTVTIEEKNTVPAIAKTVMADGSNGEYGDSATVDIIDTINYKLTVTVGKGVDGDYVITDVLPDGFVYNNDATIDGWAKDTDYSVSTDMSGNMVVTLKESKLQTLQFVDGTAPTIEITYSAKVSTDSKSDVALGANGNTNTATLEYKSQSPSDTAIVKTFAIDSTTEGTGVTKVDGTTNTPLKGVKFILTKVENETTKYAQFDSSGFLSGWTASESDATKLETDSDGHLTAKGLDSGTYNLVETDPLPGYNKLAGPIEVNITDDGTVTYKDTTVENASASTGVTVENNTGSELPSTGGMGTTALYVVGGALVIGAGITLVVRRRMSAEA